MNKLILRAALVATTFVAARKIKQLKKRSKLWYSSLIH
jgi:hypothetical protein